MSTSPVTIFFEGEPVSARAGTSVAVALWEHGVTTLSHSPKYGRPRGVHCARGHCMSCLMRVDGVPNVRVCLTEARDGMRVARQDAGAPYGGPMQEVLNRAGHLFPVGFYYKWFTKPAGLSRLFMDGLRPLTGVGRLPDPDTWRDAPEKDAARDLGHVDRVIVGAGAAGLAEALAASGPVLMVDDTIVGGQRRAALDLISERAPGVLDGLPALHGLSALLSERAAAVAARADVRLLERTAVVGAWQPDLLLLEDAEGLAVVRARSIVWTAGAYDTVADIDDNDLPGMVGPRALYRLAARDGVDLDGVATVVAGHGPDAALAATLLHAVGARVTLALPAGRQGDASLLETAARLGWALHVGVEMSAAASRKDRLSAVELTGADGSRTTVPCALAVTAGRAKPAYDVPYQLGVDLVLEPERGGYVPRGADAHRTCTTTPTGVEIVVAGEAGGADLAELLEVTA